MNDLTSETTAAVYFDSRLRDLLIVLVAALGVGGALLATASTGGLGFPLDDAWIHQTYARNLALSGQWAFVRDVPSAGSTSPLWTLLLTPAYLVGGENTFRVWVYLLGFAMLAATGMAVARLALLLDSSVRVLGRYVALIAGLAVTLEWHMVWAAGSGMETLLFSGLAVWLWWWTLRAREGVPDVWHGLLLGLLGGALTLTRPEGIVAVAMAGLYGLVSLKDLWRKRAILWIAAVAGGFAIFIVPYLLLNLSLGGTLLPNTASAKQSEYAVTRQALYIWRFARMWVAEGGPLIGAQVLLLPGLAVEVVARVRARNWRGLLPLGWAVAHVALYALRLPVTYQHGRYVMPAIPMIVLYGVLGTLRIARPAHSNLMLRTINRGWLASLLTLFPLFLAVLGVRAYQRDVRIIESEMVTTARWLQSNVEADKLVAVHDIGAIGYFTQYPIIDLAGLVSPDIIPFIRNEAALLAFMEEQQADYLVTFPDWYPQIVADPRTCVVYSTGGKWAALAGGENMAVYALHWDRQPCASRS